MNNIEVLDCTLRDGCYIVGAEFGATAIKGIIRKLCDSGVEYIECGWLKNTPHKEGTAFYHVPSDLGRYIDSKDKNKTYVLMIDWDRYELSYLPECDGRSIDAVRVVFPHGKQREGIAVGNEIKKKGYRVFFQAANTLAYSDDELIELALLINEAKPEGISVVDTFGAMYEEDLERIVTILDKYIDNDIKIGFHSHNNQQLSFALCIHFMKILNKTGRRIIVDSSLCGMGRGAGNATTELLVSYINRKMGGHYNMDAIMDAIDMYMVFFQNKYKWGYSTSYLIAGMYCCHVNNIAYLLDNHNTSAKDMRNIVESLSAADRRKYDYDLLESKYVANQSRHVDDTAACEEIKTAVSGREVLLIAPGKSSLTHQDRIGSYIDVHKPVVIAINAFVSGYRYDYAFFVNPMRYEFARIEDRQLFDSTKRILLSNIKNSPDGNEHIIAYDHAIKRGWPHFDNAVICALRLLDHLGMSTVSIAGFDGFSNVYSESYANPRLPSLNPTNNWDELNDEIRSIYSDFATNAVNVRNVFFLTSSIFNKCATPEELERER